MLISFVNLILNPYCLILFLFFSASNQSLFFENTGTNTYRLKIVPYIIYSLVFALTILLVTYFFGLFLTSELNIWEVYQPRYYWLSITGWLVTCFTLNTYFKGMEGNIMGFIFFPLLLMSSLALLIANISAIFVFFTNIDAPTVELDFLIRFPLHAFLPFYILIFIEEQTKKENVKKSWLEPILGSLIFQLLFFFINWLIIKIWGNGLTLSRFFGQGQTIVYYLPIMGGLLYYLFHFLSQYHVFPNGTSVKKVKYFFMIIASLIVLLQLFNYIVLIRKCF